MSRGYLLHFLKFCAAEKTSFLVLSSNALTGYCAPLSLSVIILYHQLQLNYVVTTTDHEYQFKYG